MIVFIEINRHCISLHSHTQKKKKRKQIDWKYSESGTYLKLSQWTWKQVKGTPSDKNL